MIFEHCDRLLERGHSVYIASECQNLSQDWFPGLRTPIVHLLDLYELEIDVIVATGCTTPWIVNKLCLPARKLYFIQGKDIFFLEHENWRRWADMTYRLLDFEPIVVSQQLRDWLKEEYGRDSTIITNGLNGQMFFPDPAIPKKDKLAVLIEGSFSAPYKGVAEAFTAAQGTGAEIWCVTPTKDEKPPGDAARIWRLPSQSMLRKIYSSADIFVNLSKLAGFLLPPMEAMACGCAVVVNNNPGVREYAEDEVNCLLVEQGDIGAAQEAIKRLVNDPELRNKLVEGGLRTVKERFDWDQSIDRLEQIYRSSPVLDLASQTADS